MNILYFFSYGTSLSVWRDTGLLERELEIFTWLNKKYGLTFTFVTYGGNNDLTIINEKKFINVVPLYTVFKKSKFKYSNLLKLYMYSKSIVDKLPKYDLIHQNQLNGSWLSLKISKISSKPIFIRTGYDLYSFSILENKSFLKKYFFKKLTKFGLEKSDAYSVSSLSDYNFLKNNFDTVDLDLLPNWVNIKPKEIRNDRFTKRVLCVGRLVEQKNFQKLILDFKGTMGKVAIDIVGEGPLKSHLKELADTYKVDVNFIGKLPNNELKELYSKYKFFLLPSLFEGNPKTLLEALASGCVVLASDIKNNNEIITDKIDGFLIKEEESYYKNYIYQFNNSDMHEKIQTSALKLIEKKFSIDKIGEAYNTIYRRITSIL